MEATQPPLTVALGTDNKRQCIRIKARVKIHSEQKTTEPATQAQRPYQAYCETVASSRSQSPDIFTTPPTHSGPFHTVQSSNAHTYTARIITRKEPTSSVLTGPKQIDSPNTSPTATEKNGKHTAASRTFSHGDTVSGSQYHTVSQSTTPRGNRLGGTSDHLSRNRTPSLPQIQLANSLPKPTVQIITARTPLQQKRYGRMECHPLPPLPPSPPETPTNATMDTRDFGQTIVNFSRGEIKGRSPQVQEQAKTPHLACVDTYIPPPVLPLPEHPAHLPSAISGHERQQSKGSGRTVTFADDTALSLRSPSPDHQSRVHDQHLRQSRSFSSEPQIPSSLRLYSSHDSLLVANNTPINGDINPHASRRTAPKDFKHKYTFGQRPTSRMATSSGLGRTSNSNYNPRLSTSKAQYRGLQTLPRPLPSSLRIAEPQTGPRQPPWGSLEDLEEQREKRMDARERDQAKQFRSTTLSQATTVGSTDSFGKEKMKREVEEYKEQVMSVYPDMAFDGNAGKGGRSCCCAVM